MPDALLYVGADLDVHMLKMMQPWETLAVFIDDFTGGDGGYATHRAMAYQRAHSDDPRTHWRWSSASIRPCPDARCMKPLMRMVVGRMKQDAEFTQVHMEKLAANEDRIANATVLFQLQRQPGVTRRLSYVIGTVGSHELARVVQSLRGRVSTLASPGASGNILHSGFVSAIPSCIRGNLTLIAASHEANMVSRFAPVTHAAMQPYPTGDMVSGRRLLHRDHEDSSTPHRYRATNTGFLTVFCVDANRASVAASGPVTAVDTDGDGDTGSR